MGTSKTIQDRLIDVCTTLVGYLTESHQEELDSNHNGDGQAGCSYCQAIEQAETAIGEAKVAAADISLHNALLRLLNWVDVRESCCCDAMIASGDLPDDQMCPLCEANLALGLEIAPRRRPYTVVVLQPGYDGVDDSSVEHVLALSADHASETARRQAAGIDDDADDFAVIACFVGHRNDLGPVGK